eukprot:scaffold4786_cov198-Amphora_coffeaeformis.AAC.22
MKFLFALSLLLSFGSSSVVEGQEQEKRNLRRLQVPPSESITPALWGPNGTNWDPENSLLRDFTDVGYNLSNSAIPDSWPIYMNVTGADDEMSDKEDFQEAINSCPEFHAIGVPNGRYIIDGPLHFNCTNCVLRGESRDGAVLYFPKHMDEILHVKTTKMSDPFIHIKGGSNRGIEHLSLVLRDETKSTGYWLDPELTKQKDKHWYYSGERMIQIDDGATDIWVRDVYVKNSNDAITIQQRNTRQVSIIDVVIDQFVYRKHQGIVGHMGIQVGSGANNVLVHNCWLTGTWSHDICPTGTKNSVFSRIKGENVELDHHARGNSFNLFTEIDLGWGGRGYGGAINNLDETYWGIKGVRESSYLPTDRNSTFVGIHTSQDTSIGPGWHHETIDPDLLSPLNIWTAQMDFHGKWVPPEKALTLPPPPDEARQLLPTDDAHVYWKRKSDNYGSSDYMIVTKNSFNSYLKFDLSGVDMGTVAAATLKIWVASINKDNVVVAVNLTEVEDDSWTESTLTYDNRPPGTKVVSNETLIEDIPGWISFDVTIEVNTVLSNQTDNFLSLLMRTTDNYNQDAQLRIPSKEEGYAPTLVLHQGFNTLVPPGDIWGLTSPTGSIYPDANSEISLRWPKSLDASVDSYNVYRDDHDGFGYQAQAMGLQTCDLFECHYTNYVAFNYTASTYIVTAVNIAGIESVANENITIQIQGPPTPPPSAQPSSSPTNTQTTSVPTHSPTAAPTVTASDMPTQVPTNGVPTTRSPSLSPSLPPSNAPTLQPPTNHPTSSPTAAASDMPTQVPTTGSPSQFPSLPPSDLPTMQPTTSNPSGLPTVTTSNVPTQVPTTSSPSLSPSLPPSNAPTLQPTTSHPTSYPTAAASDMPTQVPTSGSPSQFPSLPPSDLPTMQPTTSSPSGLPTVTASDMPTQ